VVRGNKKTPHPGLRLLANGKRYGVLKGLLSLLGGLFLGGLLRGLLLGSNFFAVDFLAVFFCAVFFFAAMFFIFFI
jgi:hypothetical protein